MNRHFAYAIALAAVVTSSAAAQPVAHWSFDEGDGLTAHDSAFGNNATLLGCAWAPGRIRQGLLLNGSTDAVYVSDSAPLRVNDQLSITGWVNGTLDGYFFGLHAMLYKGSSYYVGVSDGHVYGRIFTNQWCAVRGATRLSNDRWYHIAMTYDRNDGGAVMHDLSRFDGLRKLPNPLAIADGSAGWDTSHREIGNILYEPNSSDPQLRYKAWYTGYTGNVYVQNAVYVGWYSSPDGLHWINRGQISPLSLEDPYVVAHDGVYYMFAENKDEFNPNYPVGNIKRLHSTDLVNWIDDGNVLTATGGGTPFNWAGQDCGSPVAWIEGETWYCLYERRGTANAGAIGLATSPDGLHWTPETSPVMFPAHDGSWDSNSMIPDDLVKVNGVYHFFYHANGTRQIGTWSGLATSTDLHHWTRYAKNPFDTHETLMVLYKDQQFTFFAEDAGVGINRYQPVIVSAPRLYVDGVEEKYWQRADCNNRSVSQNNGTLAIGNSPNGAPYPFAGKLDELSIYNYALTPRELGEIAHGRTRGDLNCDGRVDNFDIDPFIMGILNPSELYSVYSECDRISDSPSRERAFDNIELDELIACVLLGGC